MCIYGFSLDTFHCTCNRCHNLWNVYQTNTRIRWSLSYKWIYLPIDKANTPLTSRSTKTLFHNLFQQERKTHLWWIYAAIITFDLKVLSANPVHHKNGVQSHRQRRSRHLCVFVPWHTNAILCKICSKISSSAEWKSQERKNNTLFYMEN